MRWGYVYKIGRYLLTYITSWRWIKASCTVCFRSTDDITSGCIKSVSSITLYTFITCIAFRAITNTTAATWAWCSTSTRMDSICFQRPKNIAITGWIRLLFRLWVNSKFKPKNNIILLSSWYLYNLQWSQLGFHLNQNILMHTCCIYPPGNLQHMYNFHYHCKDKLLDQYN